MDWHELCLLIRTVLIAFSDTELRIFVWELVLVIGLFFDSLVEKKKKNISPRAQKAMFKSDEIFSARSMRDCESRDGEQLNSPPAFLPQLY